MNSTNLEYLPDDTPETFASKLFSEEAADPNSCRVYIDIREDHNDNNNNDESTKGNIIDIFQFLLTCLLEGVQIIYGDLQNIDTAYVTSDAILLLNPWFNSIGFTINVTSIRDHNAYCKVILNNDIHAQWFNIRGIDKGYTFVISGDNLELNKNKVTLDDLTAQFKTPSEILYISFNMINSS